MDNLLQQLHNTVLEKTGSEKVAREFMTGFIAEVMEKEAGFSDLVHGAARVAKGAKDRGMHTTFKEGVGKGLGGLAIGSGVLLAGKLFGSIQNLSLKAKFVESLHQAKAMNKVIQGADQVKVKQFAETIFNFAPHVATDPNLLSTILANAIHGDGLDPMTIKTLTELEGKYRDNFSFSPKNLI